MIPDEEPWWMVRCSMQGDGSVAASAIGDWYGGSSNALPCTCPLADEPASETLHALDSLDFRPFGYEW